MNKPSRLHHVNSPVFGPFIDLIPICTLVGGGVGNGDEAIWRPLEGDQAYIGVAHGSLAEKVQTVLCSL